MPKRPPKLNDKAKPNGSSPSGPDHVNDLQAQIELLKNRIKELEEAASGTSESSVTNGTTKGRTKSRFIKTSITRRGPKNFDSIIETVPETLAFPEQDYILEETQCLAKVGGWMLDVSSGKRYWTAGTFQLFGIPASDTPPARQEILKYIEADDWAVLEKKMLEGIATGEPYSVTTKFRRADGSSGWLQTRCRPLRDASGKVAKLVGSLMDVTERLETQKRIEESEQRLRTIVENMPVMLVAVDEQERVLAWNKEAERITGYTKLEIMSDPNYLEKLYPNIEYRERMFAEYKTNGPIFRNWERELTAKNGETRYLSWSDNSARYKIPGWPSWAVAVDITERKKFEQMLTESDERYRTFVQSSSDGIWRAELPEPMRLDLPIQKQVDYIFKNAILAECNPAFAQMYGRSIDQATGLRVNELLDEGDPRNQEFLKAFVESNYRLIDAESHERDKDGKLMVILNSMVGIIEDGKLCRAWGIQRDISELKKTQEALQFSEVRARLVIDTALDAVITIDDHNKISFWNKEAENIFGWSRDEVIGKTLMDTIIPPEYHERHLAGMKRYFETGEGPILNKRIELTGLRKDGSRFPVELTVTPMRIGEYCCFNAFLRDITHRKEQEQKLGEYNKLLEQTQQMARVGGWSLEVETGKVYWTDQTYRIFNLEPGTPLPHYEEIMQKYVHPEDFDRIATLVSQLIDGGPPVSNAEMRLMLEDGSIKWIAASFDPVKDTLGRVTSIFGSVHDITERIKQEIATRESEQLHRQLETVAHSGVWRLDLRGADHYWSDGMYELMGVDPSQGPLNFESFAALVHPEDLQRLKDTVIRHLESVTPYKIEWRAIRPDGTVRSIFSYVTFETDTEGRPLRMLGTNLDITERVEAEARLDEMRVSSYREREAYLRRVLDKLPAAAYLCDRSGLITYFNERAVELWGREPKLHDSNDRFCGSFKLFYPDGRPMKHDECWMALAIKNKREYIAQEVMIERADGSRVMGLAHSSPLLTDSGELIGAVNVIIDITERKRSESLLRRNHETFYNLVQNAPLGVYIIDSDFKIAQVSAGSQKVFSNVRPLIGRDFAEALRIIWPEPFATEAIGIFRHTLATGEPYTAPRTTEQRHDIPDVESYDWRIERIVLPDGSYGVVCYFYDFTELQKIQQQLAQTVEISRQVEKVTRSGGWMLDMNNPELKPTWTKGMHECFGVTEPLEYEKFLASIHPDDRERLKSEFESAVAQSAPFDITFRYIHPDGGIRWFRAQGVTVSDQSGSSRYVYGSNADITEEVTRQQALRETERRYQRLVANSPDAIVIHKDGIVRYANEKMVKLLKVDSYKDIVGHEIWQFLHPDFHQLIKRRIANAREGQPLPLVELSFLAADGTVVEVEANATPIQYDGGLAIQVILRDLTERKRHQGELREREERFSSLANTAPVLMWVNGLEGAEFVNTQYLEFLGVQHDDIKQYDWAQFIHPDDREAYVQSYLDAVNQQSNFTAEFRFLRRDGVYRWMLSHASPRFNSEGVFTGHVGITTDIHEQKTAQAAIQQSEVRFRTVANAAPVLIWVADANNMGTWFNKPWLDFTGRTLEQELGTGWADNIHPDDRQLAYDHCMLHFNKRLEFRMEFRLRTGDGSYRWVLDHGVPMFDAEGNFNGYIGSCIDIHERKESEATLSRVSARATLAADTAKLGIWEYFFKEGKVEELKVSPRYGEIIEIDSEKIKYGFTDWKSLIHPEDFERVTTAVQQYFAGNAPDYEEEYRIKTTSGKWKWILSRSTFITRDEEGRPVYALGAVIDITERKHQELERESNRVLLDEVQRIANVGGFALELETDKVTWTEGQYRIFGVPTHERITLEQFSSLVHPEDRLHVMTTLAKHRKSGRPYENEYRIKRSDGQERIVYTTAFFIKNAAGLPATMIGATLDITERKKYERTLQENQRLLGQVQQIAKVGGWTFEAATGAVTWTEGMYDVLKAPRGSKALTQEETIMRTHPDDRERTREAFLNSLATGMPFESEQRFFRNDGQMINAVFSGVPIKDEHGKTVRIVGSLLDITARKAYERKLEDSQRLLRQVQSISKVGGLSYDLATRTYEWTAGMYEIFGLSELDGPPAAEKLIEMIHPADRDAVIREHDVRINSGKPASYEFRIVRPDGQIRHIRTSLVPIFDERREVSRLVGSVLDVTEHRSAEENLRALNERLNLALEATQFGVWEFELKTNVQHFSKEWGAMLGLTEDELVPTTAFFESLLHPDDVATTWLKFDQYLRGETAVFDTQFRMRHKDGTYRWIASNGRIVKRDDKGEPLLVMGGHRDITQFKEFQSELESNAQLLDQVQSISMVGGSSVDLKTGEYKLTPGMYRILGLDPKKGVPTKEQLGAMLHPDDVERVTGGADGRRTAGQSYSYETRIVRADGQIRHLRVTGTFIKDPSGNPIRVVASSLDITDEKKIQEQIRLAGERATLAVETANLGVWDYDLVNNKIVFTEQWANVLGYTLDEVEHTIDFLISHIHPDDRERHQESWQSHLEGKTDVHELDLRLRHKSGEYIWVHKRAKIVERDALGKPLRALGAHFDVTAARKTQEKIRLAGEQATLAADISQLGIWDWNLQTNEVEYATRWADMIGFTLDEIEPTMDYFVSRLYPDDVKSMYDEWNRHLRGETDYYQTEFRMRHKLGHWVWVRSRGKVVEWDEHRVPLRAVGAHLDITDQKLSSEILERSEERSRLAQEIANVGIFDLNLLTGQNVWSPELEAIYGLKGGSFVGSQDAFEKYVHPEDLPALKKIVQHGLESGQVQTHEFRITRSDGTLRWVVGRWQAFKDKDGTPVRMTGVNIDVTERKRAEEKLRETVETLSHVNEAIPIASFIARLKPDFRLTYMSDSVKILTGFEAEEFLLDPDFWEERMHPDDQRRAVELQTALTSEDSFTQDYRWKVADNSYRWFTVTARMVRDSTGEPDHVIGMWQDITDERKAAEDLKRSYRMLEEAQKLSLFGAWELDLWTLQMLWSDGMFAITGVDPENSKNTMEVFFNAFHEDDVEKLRQAISEASQKGKPFSHEARVIREDGSLRYVKGTGRPLSDGNKNVSKIVGTLLDVTDQKEVELALRESEARLQAAMDSLPFEFFIVDRDQTFLAQNSVSLENWGVMVDRSFDELDLPEDVHERWEALHRRLLKGETVIGDVTFIIKGKKRHFTQILAPIREGKHVHSYLGVNIDITDRKIAEEALATRERELQDFFENAPVGIHWIGPDGIIQRANQTEMQSLGYSRDEYVGRHIADFFVDRSAADELLDRLGRGETVDNFEARLRAKDGSIRQILISSNAMYENDRYIRARAFTRDITEARRLQEVSSRSQRLETAGRIAGQVAHDFNNLLGPMMAYPDLIRAELEPGHPALEYLEFIERAAAKMAEINQQLLTLGRRGHYTMEVLNVNDVVREAIKQIGDVPNNLRVTTDLAGDVLNINANSSQLSRVLLNLISNARDAMEDVGELTVSTENFYVEVGTETSTRVPTGEYVKITVSDTGSGIPRDIISRIFEPFFTTKQPDDKRGSGLGLSIVYAVIQDHGGYIDTRSVVGHGTSFYLYLPITRQKLESAPARAVVGGRESLLIVDDDRTQRQIMRSLLEKLGYTVNEVESGEAAVEYLAMNQADLVVLDMIMKGKLDGTDTFRLIRKSKPTQKAIIVSGYSESSRINEALKLGAGSFTKKPITLKTLATAVRTELDRPANS